MPDLRAISKQVTDRLKELETLLSPLQTEYEQLKSIATNLLGGTLAVGKAGAVNAALLAVAILANKDPELKKKLKKFREDQSAKILKEILS